MQGTNVTCHLVFCISVTSSDSHHFNLTFTVLTDVATMTDNLKFSGKTCILFKILHILTLGCLGTNRTTLELRYHLCKELHTHGGVDELFISKYL